MDKDKQTESKQNPIEQSVSFPLQSGVIAKVIKLPWKFRPDRTTKVTINETPQETIDRLTEENFILYAIFKTCTGCKYVVPGEVYGCPIQHHINWTGECNQRELL